MSFAALAERLTRRAEAIATARVIGRLRAGRWWHRADLLWPRFIKGDR